MPDPAAIFLQDITCPFCGLACDDLEATVSAASITVRGKGCPLAQRGFQAPPATAEPRVRGSAQPYAAAVTEAAALLAGARAPLIAGMATDMAGARALLSLADRCGAVVDHMNSGAKLRNLLAMQDGGWITTTLSEVRNRADLVVLAGGSVGERFPRFFERCVWNAETLFGLDPAKRDIVYLGRGLDTRAGAAPDGRAPRVLECDIARLGEGFAVLRALLAGVLLQCDEAAGLPLAEWRALLQRMKAARYGVMVWAAPDFDCPHAELAVQTLVELIKDLNRVTRFSGLPLGGSDGDFTANGVEMWQTGFPFRTRFGAAGPDYDPYHYSAERLLASGEADALLWVSSFDERRGPPAAGVPTVVLGRPGMRFEREPEVFIPVGVPGLDHAGHFFRTDKVVALPLRKLRETSLPPVAEAAAAIEAALSGKGG
jgi:formylmethanofuran dehydrogenase subunit B